MNTNQTRTNRLFRVTCRVTHSDRNSKAGRGVGKLYSGERAGSSARPQPGGMERP